MPKRKRYKDLSRFQQWRRRQKMDCVDNIDTDDINNIGREIEIRKERPNDNILIVENSNNYSNNNDVYLNNDLSEDIEECRTDFYSNDKESDVESELTDEYNSQCYEDLNFNLQKELLLREFLRTWSLKNNITHVALTKLLKGLRANGHENLPCDARTLLETPTTTSMINSHSGIFYYHGLQKALKDHLRHTRPLHKHPENPIKINLSIDGLPLAKSSKAQFWPLLGQITYADYREKPFVIGVFYGYCKPIKPDEIIHQFIEEYNEIQNKGFEYGGKKYKVLVNAVICDAPAKAFMKCIKGHTGYYGCDKCEEEGEWRDNRMLFLNENAPLRTDEKFLLRYNEDHHLHNSPFENIGLKMVTQFPLDYMHLVCLGVMKRLIKLWIRGIKGIKLRASQIDQLSTDLKLLIPYIPREFSRKPRGLDELENRWKATEFRLFLLYTSLVTLWSYLPNDYLRHFYALHCGISILCKPADCEYNNEYAHKLLIHFVQVFKVLYSEKYITYNMHNLIHLHEDVKNYGCLDMFSAFPFENYFQEMKQMLRKSAQPLQQLHRRLMEKSKNTINIEHEPQEYPILLKAKNEELSFGCIHSHREVKFKNFTLSCIKQADSYCYINNKHVLMIEHIGKKNGETVILGRILKNSCNVSSYPCDSRHLGIHVGDEWSEVRMYPISKISAKAMRLPYKNTFCIIPILHTND